MANHPQPEHQPTQAYGRVQGRARDVLQHIEMPLKPDAEWDDAVQYPWVGNTLALHDAPCSRVSLTRRTRMDDVKPLQWVCQRVPLHELEGVAWMRLDIDPHDLVAPRAVVAHGRAARAAEEVEE